jgi:hypothetical protein
MNPTTTEAIDLVQSGSNNFFTECLQFASTYLVFIDRFTSEDLIEAYRLTGKPQPLETRVWGAVVRRLVRDGLIRHDGFGTYKNPTGHGKPVNIWKRV